MQDPAKCGHTAFTANVDIVRLTNDGGTLTGFQADVTVKCLECETPFVWLGVPGGLNLDGVAVGVDGQQLRAACAPCYGWIPPGGFLQPRGYKVTFVEGEERHDGH